MSGLPPDYNPSASMLQGGTTSVIQPVMGGGGEIPANYNTEASLLTGGTGDIAKVLGGGAKTEGNLQGEVYSVADSDIQKKYRDDYFGKLSREYSTKKDELAAIVMSFVTERTNKIKRYESTGTAQDPTLPTVDMVQKAAGGPIPNLSVIYDVIPSDIETIIMIPPINGDNEKFVKIIQHLFKTQVFRKETTSDLRLRDGISIVCMAPFYGNNVSDRELNLLLFYLHLRLWNVNRSSFFVLNSVNSFAPGLELFTEVGGTNTQFPIVNYFNSSYLICKKPFGNYKGILFTAESGQVLESPRKDKNKSFKNPSDIYRKYDTFAVQPSMAMEDIDPVFADFLLVGSQGYKSELIKSRTDVPICKNLLTVFYDEDIHGKTYMISDKRHEIHVFRYNKIQESPILCVSESGDVPKLAPPPGNFSGKENNPRFVKAPTKQIMVEAVKYRIRIFSPQVYTNWTEGLYSKDEADLLTSLQVTPTLLHFVFDVNWKIETANFLKKIVLSDCFTDVRLLTRAECDSTRTFLDKILDYFYAHAAYKMDDGPIQRLVLPKIVLDEEESALLEPAPPQIVIPPQPNPIGSYVWSNDIRDITGKQFEKDSFDQIKLEMDGTKYFIDFIAVQKDSGQHLFKRYLFDVPLIKDEADKRGVSPILILKEKMDALRVNMPDFTILY